MKPCSFHGCVRKHYSAGLCRAHRAQQRNAKALTPIQERLRIKGTTCSLSGCLSPAVAKYLCRSHLARRDRAVAAGTLELGDWKLPISRRRLDTTVLRVRVPKVEEEALLRYAAHRGFCEEDALVELALLALGERQRWRRGA